MALTWRVAGEEGLVWIWDVGKPEKPLRTLDGQHGGIARLVYQAKGHHLVAGNHDGTLLVWDSADLDKGPLLMQCPRGRRHECGPRTRRPLPRLLRNG